MPTLVVQMGHAGRTSGATGAPGEQAYTQEVGAACARLLDGRGGWRVRTIAADPGLDLYRGDAFVAVHADGSTNPTVRGASVGYQNAVGGSLAHAWRGAYVRRGFSGPWNPDNYTDNLHWYYGVSNAIKVGNGRACIIECGTITNAEDRALMDPERVALAIGDAVGIPVPAPVPEPAPIEEVIKDMRDGDLRYARGQDDPATYIVRVRFEDDPEDPKGRPRLLRNYVSNPAELAMAEANGEHVAVVAQADLDKITKVAGSR